MLKVTGLSLLLGAVALVAVLTVFFAPPTTDGPRPQPITLNATNALFTHSVGTFANGELGLDLNQSYGTLSLVTGGVDARDYPFLHLAIEDPPQPLQVSISLEINGKKKRRRTYMLEGSFTLEDRSPESVWFAMNEFEGWTGTVTAVELVFVSRSGETIRIKDLSLYPASPSRQLRAIVSDLTSTALWQRSDMNTHTGVDKVSSFYPVPLVVALLLLSTFCYGLLLLLFRGSIKFNWTVVALIFLACWISLDLVWQNRLLHQVAHSYRTFAGKDTPEKLAVGPDHRLFNFISEAKQRLEPADARVFVSSSDIYLGMRAAYYLFPFNTYWSLELPELPAKKFLRKGDYILLISPTRIRFSKKISILKTPLDSPQEAELIFSAATGKLVRLK